jgi:hypothetical protein
MTKEFKITNTSTRKTFSSLDEVNAHISKTKLRPLNGSDVICVEEITTKYHKINLKSDKVTIETFHKLIDVLLNKLSTKSEVTYTDSGTTNLGYALRAVKDLKIPEALEHLKNGLNALEIDYDKFDKSYNAKYGSEDQDWDWIHSTFKKSKDKHGYEKHEELVKTTAIIVLKHLRAADTIHKKFKAIKLRTNYKPCNAIGIKSTYMSIGYRESGPVIGTSMFTGRNVSCKEDEVLTEVSLSKLLQ